MSQVTPLMEKGICLDPENNLNVTFLHKEIWRYRILETSLSWEGKPETTIQTMEF